MDPEAEVLENSSLVIANNLGAPVQEAVARQMDVVPVAHQMDTVHYGASDITSTTNTGPISNVSNLEVRYIPLFSKYGQSAILETRVDGVIYEVVAETGATYHYSSNWEDIDISAGVIKKQTECIGQLVDDWLKVNVVKVDKNWIQHPVECS